MEPVLEETLLDLEKKFPAGVSDEDPLEGVSHTDVVNWMLDVMPQLTAEIRRARAATKTTAIEAILEAHAVPGGEFNAIEANKHIVQIFCSGSTFSGCVKGRSKEFPGWWEFIGIQPMPGGGPPASIQILMLASKVEMVAKPFVVAKPLVQVVPAGATIAPNGRG